MAKKTTITDILKSKVSNKDNLPYWYEKRMSICNTCEFNSKNKEKLTLKEKAITAANLGKPSCTACGCEISAKASLPHAVCGLESIGQEPKWRPVTDVFKTDNVVIENISNSPIKVSERAKETVLDYGTIKQGSETDVQLLIREEGEIKNPQVNTSCGCTKSNVKQIGNDILLTIKYNTKIKGNFKKTVVLKYDKEGVTYGRIFKITGKTE